MSDLVQLVFEYRRLVHRRELVGAGLAPRGRDRLESLERLFGSEPDEDRLPSGRRRFARCDVRMAATLWSVSGATHEVEIINLGGGGLCITPAITSPLDGPVVVRVISREHGRVYHLPVRPSWHRHCGDASAMGMPFVGAPRAARLM